MKHVGIGRAWDLDRSRGGVELLQPRLGRADATRFETLEPPAGEYVRARARGEDMDAGR